ncbi:peptidylprolyl isomerase [Candidatus Methylospira mobilis]|uniref:peptidylprolyl isomerase n=1 Tax=Candidatus Methylospira mobilis TaxID=1808979 RepID=A0A5Q0BMZ3_9GAMM|nr:peptidylprolyl isomerase [Candidatus Methylospira mobilis]QFY43584.1 peptidylprolyl isomerase [Candidatus Methylospira mobilis]WNV03874.1 peptidylprolyl isomerase [Candidatus Methylospira mobilis]
MKNMYTAVSVISTAVLLSACNPSAEQAKTTATSASAQVSPDNIAAKVNNVIITRDAVAAMKADIAQRRHGNVNEIPDDKIAEELVSRELLKQEAEKNGLLKDPKLAAEVDNATRIALSQIDAQNFVKNVVISDDEAKQEYTQRIQATQTREYKARHILVASEADAKSIIEKLEKGAKFDELAKKLSKDPGSKTNGGDLGWFGPQQMVPAFSEAVVALADGATTKQPVQTQFGWHVIQREASREQEPAPFDQVKDQLKNMMQAQKLQQHLAELRKAATVEIRLAPKAQEVTPAAISEPAAPPADAKQAAPATGK